MDHSLYGFAVPFSFPLHFTRDVWAVGNPTFLDAVRRLEPNRRHRVLVVVDSSVAAGTSTLIPRIEGFFRAFPEALTLAAPPVVVPGGEAVKSDFSHPLSLLKQINDAGLDRQSFVVPIGGGAVLDMVSFAAAIAHRSIRVIRMPTTVLAQGDSGIAVKNGINLFGKKNFVGTFVPPFAVINDEQFLETLTLRDRIGGVVEAIKVSLLRDPEFFSYLESHTGEIRNGGIDVLTVLVRRSAELHLQHICGNGDPFELGSARPLDFGHWAAHRLESMTGHRLRHGEAVAIGIALDVLYSVRAGYLDARSADRILALLAAVGFRLWDDALLERSESGDSMVIRGLQEFREHLGGELHITLLRGIGSGFEVTEMDEETVVRAVQDLASRAVRAAATPLATTETYGVR